MRAGRFVSLFCILVIVLVFGVLEIPWALPAPTPILLSSEEKAPHGIVVSDGCAYWAESLGGRIKSACIGDKAPRVLAAGLGKPEGVAVDGGYVYWSEPEKGVIGRTASDGSSGITKLVTNASWAWTVRVYGDYLYWTEIEQGNIMRILKSGGIPQTLVEHRLGVPDAVVYGDHLYWPEGFIHGAGLSFIQRIPLEGGKIEEVVKAIKPWSIVIVNGKIYWTERFTGGVRSANLDGTGASLIETTQAYDPSIIATDGSYVYWTDHQTGAVKRVAMTGNSSVEVIVTQHAEPYGISSDGQYVAWTEEGGDVWMLEVKSGRISEPIFVYGLPLALAAIAIVVSLLAYRYKPRTNREKGARPDQRLMPRRV